MKRILEFLGELIFGISKDAPESMSEIEYRESFVIKYPVKKTVFWTAVASLFTLAFSLLAVFMNYGIRFLFVIFAVLSAGLLLIYLLELSFKCHVDETGLCESYGGIFKRKIPWEKIICVKQVQKNNGKTVDIALYDKSKRCSINFETNMQNAWYILKMAERKNIKIISEKKSAVAWLKRD